MTFDCIFAACQNQATLTDKAGGMLHKVVHQNGLTDTVEINHADDLERPYSISTTAGWSTGTYQYDGAGNVKAIGSQLYQ